MKRAWLRSTLFNIAFYSVTAMACIVFLPGLLLPRKLFAGIVKIWIYLVTLCEVVFLGLTYEIRGREHVPSDRPFLIAAKHQSPYETIKLRMLFKDPAIVLKKELLRIPLWGWYLAKSGVIAIDRSTPEKALSSITEGAVKMKEAGRPMVIFPQGTRVRPDETPAQKPYKPGIARIQQATDLPIIPMALNSGLFWPRKGWLKTPGKVIFQFLEPIAPGKDRKELMAEIEQKLEDESHALMNEARAEVLTEKSPGRKGLIGFLVVVLLAFGAYSYIWFAAAKEVKAGYTELVLDLTKGETIQSEPVISGYPGRITLSVESETVSNPQGYVSLQNLKAQGWPIPGAPVTVKISPVSIRTYKWNDPLVIDSLEAKINVSKDILTIAESFTRKGEFIAEATGTLDLRQESFPKPDLVVSLRNHEDLLLSLAAQGVIKERIALFVGAGFNALRDEDGAVRVPITQNGRTIYAGPIPVASLPEPRRPAPGNPPDPDQ